MPRIEVALRSDAWDIGTELAALTARNARYLRARPLHPALYGASGVRYRREPGTERWLGVAEVMRAGAGDCEDLAAWRAAEYRLLGVRARAVVVRSPGVGWHAVVRLPGGAVEDPSRRLGMGG